MVSPARRTAIVVSDMERSLHLYRDVLGMAVFYDQVIEAEATRVLNTRSSGMPSFSAASPP